MPTLRPRACATSMRCAHDHLTASIEGTSASTVKGMWKVPFTTRAGAVSTSRTDSHFHDAVALVRKQIVGLHNLVEPKRVGHEFVKREALRVHHAHQAAHPLLASRAERRDDRLVGKAGADRVE